MTLRGIELVGDTVRLHDASGATLLVAASDLKIEDKRGRTTTQARPDSRELSAAALQALAAAGTGTPAIAKIKYHKDGSVKKVKLRVYASDTAAAEAMSQIQQRVLRREARRSERPRNR